ncbi:unnamed protein product [Acanthoscelides obtectus]|uniref:DDE Tnp4 domain-containing protein n=1 Tax=Acanthoscelides obtectus TaxID=200917 RepID=A0A9P0KMH0_ACAOB|nr:unnamed protein product [Acanthoscelides obtectus]CAK1634267.1 Protein ALP1-like [Acanthoscelides obtectus]
MDAEEIALLCYMRRRKMKKEKKKKKVWVHPFISDRNRSGIFFKLYDDLRKYPEKFFNYTRMSIASFDELLNLCRNDLTKQDTIFRKSISAEEKLFVSLRYFASGCSLMELYYNYRLGHSTICTIIREVCSVICQYQEQFIGLPKTENDWEKVARGFETIANFPHCIGAIDGKHMRVIKPMHTGSLYFNYKHYFSIVLLALCDANYNFLYIDVGAYGKAAIQQFIKIVLYIIISLTNLYLFLRQTH